MINKIDLQETPCDFEAGIARFGGKADRYRQLLRRFAQDHADDGRKTLALLESDELDRAEKVAHSLKGVAGNLAVEGVSALAARIVAALRTQDPATAISCGRKLETALDTAVAEIATFLAESGSATESRASKSGDERSPSAPDSESLLRLRNLIAKHDVQAIDLFDELKPALTLIWSTRDVVEIETLLGAYRFTEAQERLDRS